MNIVIATRFYPPDTGGGGIASYARYAALGLVKAGHRVRVISAKAENSKAKQVVDGVEVFRVSPPLPSYRWTRLPILGRQVRFIRDLLYASRVRQLLLRTADDFQPDIVEYADIDAESFFHPHWLCSHVVKLHTPHKILEPYYSAKEVPYARAGIEWIEKKAICSAQGVSSPSIYLAGEVAKLVEIEPVAIRYVPNFIDTRQFNQAVEVVTPRNPLVLYVGRLEPLKGAMVFAKAIPFIIREFPKVSFVFLGADRAAEDGTSQKSHLERYFAQVGIRERIKFHGHDTPEIFLSFYERASVFVLPSLFENSPYTLLEAMSCGKACVVSRTGGMTEMAVDGESALFFEPGNSTDLAEKVITLLKNPALRKSMGKAARQRVEQEYSLEVGAEKTLAFYRDVIAKNSA